MESIGSVFAMYEQTNASSSTADSDFAKFQRESDPLAEQILACNGIEAYEAYLRESEAIRARHQEQEHKEALAKLALKAELRAAAHRFLNFEDRIEKGLKTIVGKVLMKAAGRHVHLLHA